MNKYSLKKQSSTQTSVASAEVTLPSWKEVATWRPLIRLSAVLFCVYLATGMVQALIPLRVAQITHNYGGLAVVTAGYATAGIVAGYGWGWLADRLGRRTPFVAGGLAGLAIAYIAYFVASSFPALLAVRVLEGAALGAYNVGSVALIGDHVAGRIDRGRLLGAYRTAGSLAFGLTMLTSGAIADRLGPLVPFLLSALFTATGCALALGLRDVTHPKEAAETAAAGTGTPITAARDVVVDLRARRRAASLLASLLIGTMAWQLTLTAVYSVWPNYLASVGYTKTGITRLWALASLSEVPFMLITGHLIDRIGRRKMLAMALVVIGCVFIGYLTVPQWPIIGIFQVVRALGYASFLTASLTLTVEASSYAMRGRISGLVSTLGSIGNVGGAALGGTLVSLNGFSGLLSIGSGAAFIGAAAILAARWWPVASRSPAARISAS